MSRPRLVHPAWVISLSVSCLLACLVFFPLTKIEASSLAQSVRSSDFDLPSSLRQIQHQVKPEGTGFRLQNPENQLKAEFHDGAMTAEHPEGRMGLRLEGYGYGEQLATPASASVHAAGTRIEYQRGSLTEWYVNDARGLEQGFTLRERPGRSDGGPLEIELSVSGNVQPALVGDHIELRRDGRAVLQYTGLRAWDSAGQSLDARMAMRNGRIRLVVADREAAYPITIDPWVQQQELTASDGVANDLFGSSVSVNGNTAVVGAPARNGNQGAVYVFAFSGGTWTQQQELAAAVPTAGDLFGTSVSVNGTTLIVGAPGTNSSTGAAYVFIFSGGVWAQQQELTAVAGATGDLFGSAVAVNASTATAFIGAKGSSSSQGATYVFKFGAGWTQSQKLTATAGAAGDLFGSSISLGTTLALIGAPGRLTSTGAAYVFVSGATWTQQQRLLNSPNAVGDLFGTSVSLDGTTALIGAPGKSTNQGNAYVFTQSGSTWTQQIKLAASDGVNQDLFGTGVSLSGTMAIIGAPGHTTKGAAYAFTGSGATWTQQTTDLIASDAARKFGTSVSVTGTTALIGAPQKATSQGAAYVFDFTPWTITSANSTTFTVGTSGTFTVTTTTAASFSSPALSETGALPTGVSFHDNTDGTATLSGTPAAGTGDTYTFTIIASGGGNNSATQSFTLTVNEAPTITSSNGATFTVGINGPSFQATATGFPAFPPGTFSETGTLPLNLTFSTGGTLSGKPKAGTGGLYSLTIGATNGVSPDASQPFMLTVDEAPSITSANHATVKVGNLLAFTVTASGYPTSTFSTSDSLPSGVTLASGGLLGGTPASGSGGLYNVNIAATNGILPNASQSFALTVNEPPTITSANNTTFTAGTAGTFAVTASGYPTTFTFTETGALPGGVTLGTDGTLSGTPASGTGGIYSITITAANGVLPKGTQSFTLTVNEAPKFTSANHAAFETGVAGSFQATASGFPTSMTFSEIGALPTGVTLSTGGLLSGTPAAGTGGTYSITITASNGISPDATQNFTLTVNQPPAITSANNTTFLVGAPGSFNVTATGFPAPTFTETGALPAGVTLSSAGLLGGTPQPGTGGVYSFTITAKNGFLPNATQNFTLTVNEAPSITSANFAGFAIGAPGSFTVTTLGYPAPSIMETGPIPNGLGFVDNGNGTGTLAGTPAVFIGGNFPISFTAQNGIGSPFTQPFTIILGQPPVITSVNSAAFTFGVPNSFTVMATGFPTPSLSETGGLPAGVTFVDNGNGTGTLSGTPVGAGNFNLVFLASNAVATTTQPFTLNVAGLSFTPASLNFFTVYLNKTSTATLTVTNMDPFNVNITGISITPGTANPGAYKFVNHCPAALKPNAKCTITVTLTPDTVGTLTATLNLTDNAPGSPQQISMTGNAIDPEAQFDKNPLAFGTHAVGSNTTLPLQLTNTGLTPLIIGNIGITGVNFTQVNNCPAVLTSTLSCTISVTFSPTAKVARTGTLTVTDNVAAGKSTVSLTGTGN